MSAIKDFLKEWSPKKLGKDERADTLYTYIPGIVEFYVKKGHQQPPEMAQLFTIMDDPKFLKTLLRIAKTHDDETPIDLGMASVLAEYIASRMSKTATDNAKDFSVVEGYHKAIDTILKKRIKKVSKKTGLDKNLVKELLIIIAEPEAVSNPRFMWIYVQRVLQKLYVLSGKEDLKIEGTEALQTLFKQLFGKEFLNEVAINALLDSRQKINNFSNSQKHVWNLVTSFALDTIESNDKQTIRELLEYFIDRREKDDKASRDRARRIQFAAVSNEDFPKFTKAVKKLSERDKNAKFLA